MDSFLLFRLNLNSNCVGYMKYYTSTYSFFSVDMYGWSASEIQYDSKDQAVGFYDKNQQPLFEGDMFLLNHSVEPIYCVGWSFQSELNPIFVFDGQRLKKTSLSFNTLDKTNTEFYAYLRQNEDVISLLPANFQPSTIK